MIGQKLVNPQHHRAGMLIAKLASDLFLSFARYVTRYPTGDLCVIVGADVNGPAVRTSALDRWH